MDTRRILTVAAWLVLASIGLAVTLMITGCATAYSVPPQLDQVTVRVNWSTDAQITARCGYDKVACATLGSSVFPIATIWTPKPESFDDEPRVCALGHEFLHALGARH